MTAVADINHEKLDNALKICPSVRCFDSAEKLLDSRLIDAALIAVPHYGHLMQWNVLSVVFMF